MDAVSEIFICLYGVPVSDFHMTLVKQLDRIIAQMHWYQVGMLRGQTIIFILSHLKQRSHLDGLITT
jgi:hypothetical protein